MGKATEVLKIVLRSHPINRGRRYTSYGNYGTYYKSGIHVEMVDQSVDMDTESYNTDIKHKRKT